eukprot:Transcript_30567.p4 GENE.Transcript_30567~~Transcript_30567.p4  ORF type:complete len:100 (+),score=3.93 Transcript_30567:677-976(+)
MTRRPRCRSRCRSWELERGNILHLGPGWAKEAEGGHSFIGAQGLPTSRRSAEARRSALAAGSAERGRAAAAPVPPPALPPPSPPRRPPPAAERAPRTLR